MTGLRSHSRHRDGPIHHPQGQGSVLCPPGACLRWPVRLGDLRAQWKPGSQAGGRHGCLLGQVWARVQAVPEVGLALLYFLGVDFRIKTLMVDNKCFALQLWDTAGQER